VRKGSSMSEHEHGHPHTHGWLRDMVEALPFFHGHYHGDGQVDQALESSARGIWALKVSLVILSLTALFQVAIVLVSGGVGLLADSIHNVTDALMAIPLWIAVALARRLVTQRYPMAMGARRTLLARSSSS
jgi:Co/Zn/Cd efflux system component